MCHVDRHSGTNEKPQGKRDQKRRQNRVDHDQRQRQCTVAAIDRHPHHTDHRRRNRKLQNHTSHQICIIRKYQISNTACHTRDHKMQQKHDNKQRPWCLKHICHIAKPGFKCPRKRNKSKDIGHIRHSMLCNLRKQHSKQQAGRRHKCHPALNEIVEFIKSFHN